MSNPTKIGDCVMSTGRKVTVKKRTWPHGYGKPPVMETIGEGLFHCWGVNYEEFESGPGNYTVAIVEMPDGTVLTPAPIDIVFEKE